MKNVTILILRHKNLGRGRSNPFLELMISWDLLFATFKPPLFEFALTAYSESVLKKSKHANVNINISTLLNDFIHKRQYEKKESNFI